MHTLSVPFTAPLEARKRLLDGQTGFKEPKKLQ